MTELEIIEIESVEELLSHLKAQRTLRGVVLQGLDLTGHDLSSEDLTEAVFLGCQVNESTLLAAGTAGALVFPRIPGKPFATCPSGLYTPETLFAGFDRSNPESYAETLDARVYAHWGENGRGEPGSILETLARRLHDHGISDALFELLAEGPRQAVAIMGGHGMTRDDSAYQKIAQVSRALAREGFLMCSGGGPGAMEATHLGAWFADRDQQELKEGLAILSQFAAFDAERKGEWLAPAFEVRERFPLTDPKGAPSLGIPTWLYGHEPPNPFATHIAKYFANSVREDGLLAIATYGVIYAPGSAGTIQEVFQDACQNHYNTVGVVSPMIFLDEQFWTKTKPVFPLLKQLAEGKDYARFLSITDDVQVMVRQIMDYRKTREAGD